jgi:hypothetical protein
MSTVSFPIVAFVSFHGHVSFIGKMSELVTVGVRTSECASYPGGFGYRVTVSDPQTVRAPRPVPAPWTITILVPVRLTIASSLQIPPECGQLVGRSTSGGFPYHIVSNLMQSKLH